MNLLIDENVDRQIVERLRQDGRLSSDGVVLMRLAGLSAEQKARVVSNAFRKHEVEFAHAFSVISPGRVRIRPRA